MSASTPQDTVKALPEGWMEIGAGVVDFICKALGVSKSHLNETEAAYQAAQLARGIGAAALLSMECAVADLKAKEFLQQLSKKP